MLILASQSPRRRELLARLGLPFTVRAADVDETMDQDVPPEEEVARLSARKAAAAAAGPGDVVVAADTVVVLDHRVLGKPRDAAEARAMLTALSGRSHQVMTGLTVRRGGEIQTETAVTQVRFRPLSSGEIDAYVATGEPMDKAGAYGIQGLAAVFADRLDGDYYNVMGLPLCALCRMLRRAGLPVLGETAN
ncbi:MAG: septum formation inhibitor Maf [Oscillospiraceae bacterium]|nr:septum formation inhibitor Maf [Oscillospiraceae bacterium]